MSFAFSATSVGTALNFTTSWLVHWVRQKFSLLNFCVARLSYETQVKLTEPTYTTYRNFDVPLTYLTETSHVILLQLMLTFGVCVNAALLLRR